jgi:hypothetical protein
MAGQYKFLQIGHTYTGAPVFWGPGRPPLTTPLRAGPVLFKNKRKRSPNPTLVQSEKYRRSILIQKHVEYEY